ncbi:hypothetical protein H7849_03625 [Alloacidobacterium dinghuense]|uniref:Uncharacterized protein n=1 Tax=Alloacidobacterium dinghuense TaxID=2763107 RepID=A0A7G8BKK9_9BACT|nr:hypothetical protein [Alloacidobacterium dinghuense]QNI33079.1 hypothetical protein H7849_03625 [Alloacidobacterium dinghuense]
MRLGFVQTLIDCRRVGYYDKHIYVERHPQYPVKDGEGKPWFKGEAINLVTVKSDEINPSKDFRIEVTDEPHCSFPLVCPFVSPNENLVALDFHDSFKTCLLARVYVGDGQTPGHTFEDQVFLHEVRWEFDVGGKYAAGPPPSVTRAELNGYRHVGAGLAIPWPYDRPAGIVLDTSPMNYRDLPDGTQVPISTSANSTKQCMVIRQPTTLVKQW